ncbi:hypothetical protein FSARC_13144 [Fusarium sarcochroum]|uniref:Duf1665 domain containing protein n=1 Tax=Fusarium sarcochroum TaxID=1208366 RepID=A0A8H4T3D4_9HYPO|nr:hypothetical protein FSARC_13144 [Fusarium sarcochroum]
MPENQEIKLPGFGLPLNYHVEDPFPVIIGDQEDDWKASTLTIREVCMLKVIEELTNKPEWWLKVNDPDTAAKWMKEAMEMPWAEYRRHADFTQKMAESFAFTNNPRQCITELRKKAEIYQETGLIPVMDYTTAVIKSDNLITQELREALKAAVAPLENVPDEQKDWHPGSDGKVLDIVHPSLWPLVYGRSRILSDKRINVEEALEHCGTGIVLPEDPPTDPKGFVLEADYHNHMFPMNTLSKRFQWLPCDVDLTGERPRIDSYINNVHPTKHAGLYSVIEQFIEKSLPAWDTIYRWNEEFEVLRLRSWDVYPKCRVPEICRLENRPWSCSQRARPLDEDEFPRAKNLSEYYRSDQAERDEKWYKSTHWPEVPEPKTEADELIQLNPSDVKTSGFFDDTSRVQVIVKLANIHLTPEKPTYDGGSWHIEGQLNEHICATALYYYDCDNITESRLDFRTPANQEDMMMELNHEQGDYENIERIYDIRSSEDTIQNIGSVLTRQDRMLFFPNVYQHHVSPFQLADKTRPGHRKILALFLVDPLIPVISTANVPPQQRHWWTETLVSNDRPSHLPPELTDMVIENLDFPISLEDAKEIRKELMEERTTSQDDLNNDLRNLEWNFCEH